MTIKSESGGTIEGTRVVPADQWGAVVMQEVLLQAAGKATANGMPKGSVTVATTFTVSVDKDNKAINIWMPSLVDQQTVTSIPLSFAPANASTPDIVLLEA